MTSSRSKVIRSEVLGVLATNGAWTLTCATARVALLAGPGRPRRTEAMRSRVTTLLWICLSVAQRPHGPVSKKRRFGISSRTLDDFSRHYFRLNENICPNPRNNA